MQISRIRVAIIALLLPAALPLQAADLSVHLQGLRTPAGTVRVAVVDGADGWDGKAPPVAGTQVAADGDGARVVFRDLAPGAYAVMATHDENDNGRLDTNLAGLPVEGYGFSNNPRVMRKPTFDEARFELGADDLALDIAIR
ncbi:DUF2141 domain-containing protein [Luteimonas salinilitoris]|uniref:DUF2141 domain-containing protein n=1 Tax=Luteimonas salinilitoris TaxID=3237697 RepID=A0ABV4HN18_9GAMM